MNWGAFKTACPEIADRARNRFEQDQLVLLGTIRRDGSARISPCEVDFAADRLFLGMMWQSRKALDLLRDPRLLVHSLPGGRMNPGGDIKLYGNVVDERDPDLREAFGRAIEARIDWRPDEPYHLFSLDMEWASFIVFGKGGHALIWHPDRGIRRQAVH